MRYLLTPIKEIDTSKYEVMISCSLFKMVNPYKSFKEKYLDRLSTWINQLPSKTYVRLYVDASVLDDIDILMEEVNDKLEIIMFQFDDFLMEDGIHHDGTFGSIVRFMSFYDEFRPRNIKYIWITDIDIYPRVVDEKFLKNMIKEKADVSYLSMVCYNKPWISEDFPVIAYRIIVNVNNVKLDFNNTFIKYLIDVKNNKYSYIYDEIKIYYENDPPKKNSFNVIKYFPYGFDELFIDKILLKEFNKYKRYISVVIHLFDFKKRLEDKNKIKEYIKLNQIIWDYQYHPTIKTKKVFLEYVEEIYDLVKDEECVKKYGKFLKNVNFNDIPLVYNTIRSPKKK